MILFGCQDKGPANYLSLLNQGLKSGTKWIGSELVKPYFSSQGFVLADLDLIYDNINLVVTGTCLGEGLDKELLFEAKERRIKSVSIVDHWSWYHKRFVLDGQLLPPDFIILNDQTAVESAVLDGLPRNILFPLGNPGLESLIYQRPSASLKNEVLAQFNLSNEKRTIVFVSEDLSVDFKKNTLDFLGYDEYDVLKIAQSALSPKDQLVIKLNPAEDKNKYGELKLKDNVLILDNLSFNRLSVLGDVFIGMASMLLLELAVIGEKVFSLRPNALKSFIGEELGMTIPSQNTKSIKILLNNELKRPSNVEKRFVGSTHRITTFLNNLTL